MEIINIQIDKLKPFENNPKIHSPKQIAKLEKSITEFGWTNPVLISKDNMILAGHARVKAAQKLNLSEIPVIYLDLPYEKAIAYVLADNKLAELAEWDDDKLNLVFEELSGFDDFDLELTGFDVDELDNFEFGGGVVDDDFDVDEAVEEIDEPITKLGDLIILGEHRLLCGDAMNKDNVTKLIGDLMLEIIVVTDPPYGVSIVNTNSETVGGGSDLGFVGAGNWVDVHRFRPIIGDENTEAIKEHYAILKEIDIIKGYIVFGGNYFTDILPPSSCWVIWDKREGIPSNNFADCEIAWTNFNSPSRIYRHLWSGLLRKGNREEELISRIHPTQKPVGLFKTIINDYCKNDQTVLDCFSGSGTTLIACEQLDRTCYTMELDPIYCDVIVKRWEEFTGKQAVRP